MSPAAEFAAGLWGCAYLADCPPPAIPGTQVRPGHPGDINDPERFEDTED